MFKVYYLVLFEIIWVISGDLGVVEKGKVSRFFNYMADHSTVTTPVPSLRRRGASFVNF